jgi:hypothetical protein
VADQTAYPDGVASEEAVGSVLNLHDADIQAIGSISLDAYGFLTGATPISATGSVSLGGSAWMTAVPQGEDTMQAHGYIHFGSWARMSGGEVLPPYIPVGPYGVPDFADNELLSMDVTINGLAVRRAEISDFTIELDNEGGPKAATLSVAHDLTRGAPKLLKGLHVEYKGQVLFHGRLEQIVSDLSGSMGYTLTYACSLVSLRDHKAFRAIYVDSDLDNWQTDQGPRSSPDTFEVVSRASGNTA